MFQGQFAYACRYRPLEFGDLLEQAETAFIGVVEEIEDYKVNLRVNRVLKNAAAGEIYTTEQGSSSCHIRFQVGQHWLFLGPTQMSGSRLLKSSTGDVIQHNTEFVRHLIGDEDDQHCLSNEECLPLAEQEE